MDSFLAKHVMNLHSGGFNNMNLDNEDVEESDTFFKRIKCGSKDSFEAIPSSVLRKYIAYAKKFINPKLSIEAAALLQDYYLHIRKTFTSMDSLPVTTRQLESMIRLSIARAKAELREVVTREDAMDVIEILNYSLFGLMKKTSDNHSNKRPSSKREEVQTFIECLRNFPDREINSADLKELHQNLELKIPMHELLSKINHEGILLQKGNGIYKITL
jgi:DNA helicase MCM8